MGVLSWLGRRAPTPEAPVPGALRAVIELGRFDKGGLERVVFDTARGFDRARIAPMIVSVGGLGTLAQAARRLGLRVEGLPRRDPLSAYARLLDEFAPALAVSHFSSAGLELLDKRNVPIISVIHNIYAFLDDAGRARFAEDDRRIARYIAVSPKAAEYVSARFGVAPGRIETIPNGLDLADFARRRATARPIPRGRLGIAPNDFVFLNIAAYNLHKGHHLMADAMRRLLARRRDIRIVCVGNTVNPAHLAALRARLAAEGTDRHMLLPGYAARVEDWLAMADAFLLPSFIEGWGIAMSEAMAFGKPMIRTDTGGASDVIEGDDVGILLPNEYGETITLDQTLLDRLAYDTREFRTTDALVRAMERMADNRAHWAAAGARGMEKLRARYDLRDMVRRHEAVMRAVAAGARPA
jgi:glycosyltransferase involved in cell wall biosynthesis